MKISAQTSPKQLPSLSSECLIIPMFSDRAVSPNLKALNDTVGGMLVALKRRGDFDAEPGRSMLLPLIESECEAQRILLLGFGKYRALDAENFRKALADLYQTLNALPISSAHFLLSECRHDKKLSALAHQDIASLMVSQSYRYNTTLSEKSKAAKFKELVILSSQARWATAALNRGTAIGEGLNTAKQLGNLPGNICTPKYLAKTANAMAKKYSALKTTVLDEAEMKKLGMGSLLSVSHGSREPARLISMAYTGAKGKRANTVLVGKGITFDTGGISLKPGAAMDEMKFDMCGAASVFGVMTALAEMEAKINVVGIVAAAENMPGSRATKPGDIVTSMSGKTIEILNTDAEGRLVLCDALTYAARYKPRAVIDIATLTGAAIIALGHHASGLFSNDDKLAEQLLDAGEETGDRAWRLPIWAPYHKQLESNFADLANIGGRPAGSITAACFLAQFAEDYSWAHLDIAGTAWRSGKAKGATGKPVEMLMQYLLKHA